MKKLIIAMALACAAVVANAAAVAWNSGTFSNGFKGPDGATLANSVLYTMTVSFFSDATGTEVIADVTGNSLAKAKANGAYNTTTSDSFSSDSTYYVQAIITGTDANGVAWTRKTGVEAFATMAQGNASLNFTTGAGFASAGNKWGAWTSQSVPEPTSGLLLLLGMAGLALKRKNA